MSRVGHVSGFSGIGAGLRSNGRIVWKNPSNRTPKAYSSAESKMTMNTMSSVCGCAPLSGPTPNVFADR